MKVLKKFKALYEKSPKISELKKQTDENYIAFKNKQGLPVAITNVKKFMRYMPHEPSFYKFFERYQTFWIIPCDTPDGEIYGFLLRSVGGKGFRVCRAEGAPQLLYGFHTFKNFVYGQKIILVEGAKDAEFLSSFYPFTLAMLTDSLSVDGIKILKMLTNRVVLGLDNDPAGKRMRFVLRKRLTEARISVSEIIPDLQDWGCYFSKDSPSTKEEIRLLMGVEGLAVS